MKRKVNNMRLNADLKGLSTLVTVILMIIAAIVGGIIAYAFTIAAYTEIPERTTLVITGVYFEEEENATSFKISVLNPSYSPTDATLYGIALSVKGENQLYYVTETKPAIGNGIVIPRSEALNITCSKIEKGSEALSFGEFAVEFAGKSIIVHIFSSNSTASNIEIALPS